MKNIKKICFLIAIFISSIQLINAQCSVSVTTGTGAIQTSFAIVTGQSFKPTCTAKLNNITFPNININSDDFRNTGHQN